MRILLVETKSKLQKREPWNKIIEQFLKFNTIFVISKIEIVRYVNDFAIINEDKAIFIFVKHFSMYFKK
jgi:hypothetical protein